MREFTQVIDERYFNLLWRSLSAQELELVQAIEGSPDADESALLGNDLVFLRLCKKELEEKAQSAGFSSSAFVLDDGHVDLSEL